MPEACIPMLSAPVFAIVFFFLRPTFTNFSLILKRYQFAGILLDLVAIGAVIRASIPRFRRCTRTQKHYGSHNQ
jgi:hypothetical protein